MLPHNIRLRVLDNPSDEQIESLTRLLMAAFYSDAGVHAVLDGLHTDEALYHSFMRVQVLALAHSGEIWVAEEDVVEDGKEEKIVGLGGWYAPGRDFLDTEEQRQAAGLEGFIALLPEELRNWWTGYYLPLIDKYPHRWIGPTTLKDNWFLIALAVLPEYQGKGIGRALLEARGRPALEQGKRVLWNAGLPERVAMYESWGAVIRGSEVVSSLGRKTTVALWTLELQRAEEISVGDCLDNVMSIGMRIV